MLIWAVPICEAAGQVTAAVVPREGADVTPDEVIAFCRERLAGFKVPKHVVVVRELPKNASGKILKRELRDRYAAIADRTV